MYSINVFSTTSPHRNKYICCTVSFRKLSKKRCLSRRSICNSINIPYLCQQSILCCVCFSVNRSEGDINLSELSLSSVGSPGAGDMGFQSPMLNGKVHRHSNTPRSSRYHHSSVCILFSILLIGQLN